MDRPERLLKRFLIALSSLVFASSFLVFIPMGIAEGIAGDDVEVSLQQMRDLKYVTGTILIDESPDKVWRVMVNPFEFENKICPHMKSVEVLEDTAALSILKCVIDVGIPFFPKLVYVVESKYTPSRIEFKRIGGSLKDFRGVWSIQAVDGGAKTKLTYSMYIDPGFFVPQWIVREGVKQELPRTLLALRDRVRGVYVDKNPPERRSILAVVLPQQLEAETVEVRHRQTIAN